MREFGTLSCWSGSKGSSGSPVHLSQERCLKSFPFLSLRLLSPSDWHHSWHKAHSPAGAGSWGHFHSQLSPPDANCRSGVTEKMNWTHPLHTAMSVWAASPSSHRQCQNRRGMQELAEPPKTSQPSPSPLTNSHCRQVAKKATGWAVSRNEILIPGSLLSLMALETKITCPAATQARLENR